MPYERLWQWRNVIRPWYHAQIKELQVMDSISRRPWVLQMIQRPIPYFEWVWVLRARTYLAHDYSTLSRTWQLKQGSTVRYCGITNPKTLSAKLLGRYASLPSKTHMFFQRISSRHVSVTLFSRGSHTVGPLKNFLSQISRTNVHMLANEDISEIRQIEGSESRVVKEAN